MAVSLKCAACGTDVEFLGLSPVEEEVCPGCSVRVRQRPGDQQMAIPVSMDLPETFQPVDLKAVAGKSDLLVGRYRKTTEVAPQGISSELVLARALEALANSIQHLEDRIDGRDREVPGRSIPENANGHGIENGHALSNGAPAAELNGGGRGEEVVHLGVEDEEEDPIRKASPVGARVLCRREAAKEAHAFRREKHSQQDWDTRPDHPKGKTGFAWLMENFPKTTVLFSSVGAMAIIVLTILGMEGFFENDPAPLNTTPQTRSTPLGDLWRDKPDQAQAETVARGFLNATSAHTAAPFIYESEAIEGKFQKYYTPINSPDSYQLTLRDDAVVDAGKIFAYEVTVGQEEPRLLVVLREGAMPKVFWEFFGEVGDMSWEQYMSERPAEPTLMRVWASKAEEYFEPYDSDDWQCYLLHNTAKKHEIYAYVKRGSGPDWRLSNALATKPVPFRRHPAVMAQVKIIFMAEVPKLDGERAYVVEIKDVPSTEWLPERFQPKE